MATTYLPPRWLGQDRAGNTVYEIKAIRRQGGRARLLYFRETNRVAHLALVGVMEQAKKHQKKEMP